MGGVCVTFFAAFLPTDSFAVSFFLISEKDIQNLGLKGYIPCSLPGGWPQKILEGWQTVESCYKKTVKLKTGEFDNFNCFT